MARFGDLSSCDRLLELADAPENRIRRAAGYALTEIGRRQPAEMQRRLSSLEIEGQRGIQLCRVLEVVGSASDTERLTAAISAPDPALRGAALRTLATTAGADAVETIALAMTDVELSVREAATVALARVGSPAAETIVSALRTAEGPLRAALARALGKVGHPEAPEILKGLCTEKAEVSLAALAALKELDVGRDAGLEALVRSHDDGEIVKRALALLGTEISPSRLVDLIGHPAWDVRLAVVDLLSRMRGSGGARASLEARLAEEEDDLVRQAIVRVLEASKEASKESEV
jgi:HEAT repeat protein